MPRATRVYKLYGANNADTNALASLIIQQTGVITAIVGHITRESGAAQTNAVGELSFSSVGQTATNDTVGPIFAVTTLGAFTAAGSVNQTNVGHVSNIAIPVQSGDRLYLNLKMSGAAQTYVTFFVYVLA